MRLEQHDIVTLDEAESVDSLTKKLGDLLVNQKLRLNHCRILHWRETGFSIVRSRRYALILRCGLCHLY